MGCYFVMSILVGLVASSLLFKIVARECKVRGYNVNLFYPNTSKQKLMCLVLVGVLVMLAPIVIIILLNKELRETAETVFIDKFFTQLKEMI